MMADKGIYSSVWFVYIAECRGGVLYVGITKDVSKRIEEHNSTKKCRYTRYRKPLILLYAEVSENYKIARKRELEIKRFSRKKKLALIGKDPSPLRGSGSVLPQEIDSKTESWQSG